MEAITTYAVTADGNPQRDYVAHSELAAVQKFLASLQHGPIGPSHTVEEATETMRGYAAKHPALKLGVAKVRMVNAGQVATY